MNVGIVILNYNTSEMTIALAERCHDYANIQHVVIVDNASTDESDDTISRYLDSGDHHGIDYIHNDENLGYARGNNVGLRYLARHCGCDFCIVSNPDVFFDEVLVDALVYSFERNPEYAVLTTARRFDDSEKQIRQYWSLPSYWHLVLEDFYLGQRFFSKQEVLACDPSEGLKSEDVAPGAFFAILTNVLEGVGYLDEHTFLYFEENCLAQKVLAYGAKIGILCNLQYTVITDKPNSTSVIRKTTNGRWCYIRSKEYYAKRYVTKNPFLLGLLFLADRWFVFEKWVPIHIPRR